MIGIDSGSRELSSFGLFTARDELELALLAGWFDESDAASAGRLNEEERRSDIAWPPMPGILLEVAGALNVEGRFCGVGSVDWILV